MLQLSFQKTILDKEAVVVSVWVCVCVCVRERERERWQSHRVFIQFFGRAMTPLVYLKSRPLFDYFRPFLVTISIIQIEKV